MKAGFRKKLDVPGFQCCIRLQEIIVSVVVRTPTSKAKTIKNILALVPPDRFSVFILHCNQ